MSRDGDVIARYNEQVVKSYENRLKGGHIQPGGDLYLLLQVSGYRRTMINSIRNYKVEHISKRGHVHMHNKLGPDMWHIVHMWLGSPRAPNSIYNTLNVSGDVIRHWHDETLIDQHRGMPNILWVDHATDVLMQMVHDAHEYAEKIGEMYGPAS